MDDRERGLYDKYKVERVDGKAAGRCIVLPMDDKNSWTALLVWADTVECDGYKQLAAEVRAHVTKAKHEELHDFLSSRMYNIEKYGDEDAISDMALHCYEDVFDWLNYMEI